ncbi:peptide ABC transporter permease [Alicyclobacillus cellulosilyticus]|uniref:Peptide ABC transporter permease n=1 Tax=Alicyclobacillus cellulosilyticus TaxID=1003997 RepID=A0A917KHC7_9BACL|nr:ABC transporter permease [Alicyclobacillus cellulosilyticus]GGJ13637.1 peptide ABC transporter permease [Alicyclobacillus cellulosilyticus]
MSSVPSLIHPVPSLVFRRRSAWRRFVRSKLSVAGLVWLTLIAAATAFGPWLAPHRPTDMDFMHANEGPSWQFPFGTNNLGQDLFSMVLYGIRYSMVIAVVATAVAFLVGAVIGLAAGMRGGWVDHVLMRFTDFMFAFPGFYFAMILLVTLGRGMPSLILAIGVTQWAGFARLIRGLVLTMRDGDLVESGHAIGASTWYIATRYVFPNIVNSIIVYTAFTMANMMNQEAMLSLIGFGPELPVVSFGTLMAMGATYDLGYTYLMYIPTSIFILTLMSLVAVGDGLQEMLSPKGAVK